MVLVQSLRRWADKAGSSLLASYEAVVGPVWAREASRRRDLYCRRYIAISGSCGKSTTTMLTHRLIGDQCDAALGLLSNTTRWSLRSLRKLDRPVDYLVQEVSEYPPGTLAAVGSITRPDAAIVTSIGTDHQVVYRKPELAAAELRALAAAVAADGVLCVRADDPLAAAVAEAASARVVFFGTGPKAHVRARNVRPQFPGRLAFDLSVEGRNYPVQTRFVGTVMLGNILGALAIVWALGLDLQRAIDTLARIEPIDRRLSVREGADGHTYLLDNYKASFWSTKLLVGDLPNLTAGRRIFVLSRMSDVGSNESQKYRQILRLAADRADLVVGIERGGEASSRLRGIEPGRTNLRSVVGLDELAALLRAEQPALVIIKGNKLDCSRLFLPAVPLAVGG